MVSCVPDCSYYAVMLVINEDRNFLLYLRFPKYSCAICKLQLVNEAKFN